MKNQTYREPYRPQFHFSSKKNWLNDPNGCVYYKGQYHLFFQHNPKGVEWGNMTWGHAVSSDLIHWEQKKNAITPDTLGTIYSGSAVVDFENTSGFKKGKEAPLVAAFTYAGQFGKPSKPYTQALAFSNNAGKTWTKYKNNPILPNQSGASDRDPKIFWYEKTQRWIMVLYLDKTRSFGFYSSLGLKKWKKESEFESLYECPDFFELAVDGNPKETRWVLHDATGQYLTGTFDGKNFKADKTKKRKLDHGKNYYAAQSFNNMPDKRRVSIAWMYQSCHPGMPFNQQMSIPTELTLISTRKGLTLCRKPIDEISSLVVSQNKLRPRVLKEKAPNPLKDISGELFDIEIDFNLGKAKEFCFVIRGQVYSYDVKRELLVGPDNSKLKLKPIKGNIILRFIVDRSSIEVFANGGIASQSTIVLFPKRDKTLDLYVRGGEAKLESCLVRKLKSIW